MTAAKRSPAYRRILLKLSGEALLGDKTFGIDRKFTDYLAGEIKQAHKLGVQVSAVAGATSSAGCPTPRRAWTACPPTTWACSPP
jgi:glutamate 5-kinase